MIGALDQALQDRIISHLLDDDGDTTGKGDLKVLAEQVAATVGAEGFLLRAMSDLDRFLLSPAAVGQAEARAEDLLDAVEYLEVERVGAETSAGGHKIVSIGSAKAKPAPRPRRLLWTALAVGVLAALAVMVINTGGPPGTKGVPGLSSPSGAAVMAAADALEPRFRSVGVAGTELDPFGQGYRHAVLTALIEDAQRAGRSLDSLDARVQRLLSPSERRVFPGTAAFVQTLAATCDAQPCQLGGFAFELRLQLDGDAAAFVRVQARPQAGQLLDYADLQFYGDAKAWVGQLREARSSSKSSQTTRGRWRQVIDALLGLEL